MNKFDRRIRAFSKKIPGWALVNYMCITTSTLRQLNGTLRMRLSFFATRDILVHRQLICALRIQINTKGLWAGDIRWEPSGLGVRFGLGAPTYRKDSFQGSKSPKGSWSPSIMDLIDPFRYR
jgi:hypothetical protein